MQIEHETKNTRRLRRALLSLCLLCPATAQAYTNAEIDAAARVAKNVGVYDVIADDIFAGRNNNTPGSLAVQAILINELKRIGLGLNVTQTGDDTYKQSFAGLAPGTNLLAYIPGSSLPGEYIMVGAHYDHLGGSPPNVFNGATDNASGVGAVLAVAAAIQSLPTPPQRSVIIALWDSEEDGLAGSEFFSNNPLVPLSSIKSYVNFDISGQNLLPSLRSTTFAIGAESGGLLQQLLLLVAGQESELNVTPLSRAFGQDRSDHASFVDDGVPVVFFSDATGSCYHTTGDDVSIVDVDKLGEEAAFAFRVVVGLTEAVAPPAFKPTSPFGTVYQDAVQILAAIDLALADLSLFPTADQAAILSAQAAVQTVVDDGATNFNGGDGITVLLAAQDLLNAVEALPCDGFVPAHLPSASAPIRVAISVLLIGLGAVAARRRRRRP